MPGFYHWYGEKKRNVVILFDQLAFATAQGVPFGVRKGSPPAGSHLQMTSGFTLEKPQERGRLGRLCGAALIRCCGGDKTSDSLIDGLADITIPCESTEWPMPGPHF